MGLPCFLWRSLNTLWLKNSTNSQRTKKTINITKLQTYSYQILISVRTKRSPPTIKNLREHLKNIAQVLIQPILIWDEVILRFRAGLGRDWSDQNLLSECRLWSFPIAVIGTRILSLIDAQPYPPFWPHFFLRLTLKLFS